MYIFLDESGNFTKDEESYFILGGFITSYPRRTEKAFRKWQHTKFPKKLRYRAEVKFSDTGLNEQLRLRTMAHFAQQDIRVFYTSLKKVNIPLEYRKKKGIETGLLYAGVVTKTLLLLLPTGDLEFRVFRDHRHLKKLRQKDFNEKLRFNLLPKLPAKALLELEAVDSAANANIQIADWICGALYRYYNEKENGKDYHSILKNSIIAAEELFKNYWQELHTNKNEKSPLKR